MDPFPSLIVHVEVAAAAVTVPFLLLCSISLSHGGMKTVFVVAEVTVCHPQSSLRHLQGGMTVIVVAHRLSTIRTADAICLVKGGRVAERGTHAELMRLGGEYSKLVGRQLEPAAASERGKAAAR